MKRIILLFLFVFFIKFLFSQDLSFKKAEFVWATDAPAQTRQTDKFADEDLVIIDENIKLNLVNRYVQTLNKNCIIKVNTAEGAKKMISVSLPESFDIGSDKKLIQQGRQKYTQAPFIYLFKIVHFAARVLKKSGKVIEFPVNVKFNKVFWVEENGNRLEDFNYIFSFDNVEAGDVLEYNYEIEFKGRYGGNMFLFNGEISKQNLNIDVKYTPIKGFEHQQIIFAGNGADSLMTQTSTMAKTLHVITCNYKAENLASLNYPVNSRAGKNLPYIFIDLNFLTFIGFSVIPGDALVFKDRGSKFEWLPLSTLYKEKANYDKQHANVRKFISTLPNDESNPDHSVFLARLNDTLNTLKFVSAESMNYSDESQYSVGSGEWLVKGKIIEEFMFSLNWQLLTESKMPKNIICVQDKRLGEHNPNFRSTYKYEYNLPGISNGKSILYMMPRVDGRKYNLDEIPFYIEGVTAAVMNFDYEEVEMNRLISPKVIAFIRTSSSTENENVRTENAVLKIDLDSSLINVSIKENLNGQFSTIIRPLYHNEPIDSTVNSIYFRKCTDKPNAKSVVINKTFSGKTFPFKNSFTCSERISFSKVGEIPMINWFSFPLNKQLVPEKPHFDYYFDFEFTDIYNYMVEFNKPATILNVDDFSRSLSNDYFELVSKMVKQTETSYLISVMVKVKEPSILKADMQKLMDFVNELDAINALTLKFK